ncbi:transcriptional regulator [Capnocytophaga canimorsus]|uniref:helix-turn-helix domain-containing protein n=1 Tax=Capnocytophaga canimorsus TaxID=28188 RepID=UPI001AC2C3A8|nr:helix-turn-helix domain-containing protein [Capnocytophaga canimorsus]GIM55754.1 transcriptional regulator [Capnocytophaga canimorsus]
MIQNEYQYNAITKRIDELLELVNDNTPTTDKDYIELDILSEMVEKYEEIHYPIGTPTLADTIKLRMYEMNLTQVKVSELIGVSPSRVSEYLTGKSEPTLKVARNIAQRLNISPNIVLGI